MTDYSVVSLPRRVLKEVDKLIEDLGYWPSRSAFAREACLMKIKRERQNARAEG